MKDLQYHLQDNIVIEKKFRKHKMKYFQNYNTGCPEIRRPIVIDFFSETVPPINVKIPYAFNPKCSLEMILKDFKLAFL